MASTVIQPVCDALVDLLRGLVVDGTALSVPDDGWARLGVTVPGAEIEVPDGSRSEPDQGESQLGSDDWDLEFPVTLWVDLTDPTVSQKRLVEYLELFVAAVDDDRSLGGVVLDSSVVSWQRVYGVDRTRPLVGFETTVGVLQLVPSS